MPAEIAALKTSVDRDWHAATLAQQGQGVLNTNFEMPVPASLEGQYQLDLRATDTLGNRLSSPAAWRGIIDTLAPRITVQGRFTGKSYFDANSNATRNEIAYVCAAEDRFLDEATFACCGNSITPPARTFENDPIIAGLFPDLVIRDSLVNSYTSWERTTTPSATVSACDIYGNCTTQGLPVTGAFATLAAAAITEPSAVIVKPTDGSVIAGTSSISVTISAQSNVALKTVLVRLGTQTVVTLSFAKASTVTQFQKTINVPVSGGGRRTLWIRANDWNGRLQTIPFTSGFTLDTAAPVVSIDPATLTAADSYALGSRILRFNGTATDGQGISSVKVRVSNQPYQDAAFGADTWRIAYPVKDPERRRLAVVVRVTDLAGRVTEVTGILGTNLVDGTPPNTVITGKPANPSSVTSAIFTFTGTGIAEAAAFECRIDSGAFAPCTSGVSYTGLTVDVHTFHVRARTIAGSFSAITKYTWKIINTGPKVANVNVRTSINTAVAIALRATDDDPITYRIVRGPANGVLLGTVPNLSYHPNTNFVGTETFTYVANDGLLESGIIATVTIVVEAASQTSSHSTSLTGSVDNRVFMPLIGR